MFWNNNNKIIYNLTFKSIKTSKMKNFFIILTVVLSVSLLSGISLTMLGIQENEKRQLETMQHVIYHNITDKQIKGLQQDIRVDCMSLYKLGKSMEVDNYILTPCYYDDVQNQIVTIKIAEGSYPQKIDEIAVDKSYMERINKEAVIGQKLEFTFLDGSKEEFTITGFTDNKLVSSVYHLLFSKEYAKKGSQLKDIPYNAAVRIKDTKNISENEFLDEIRQIGSDLNIERKNINENNAFVNSLDITNQEILIIVIVGTGILFVSILVIYSIFYLSVVGRVRQFGQFRTIGMTKKQIKKMVNLEGIILCIIGFPIGFLIGSLFAYFIKPQGWNFKTTIVVFFIILIVDLITILISIRKPAKLASSISPIEASKSSGYVDNTNKKVSKKLHRELNPFSLAKISSNRNRKKTLLTVISLGIGGVLYIIGATYIISMNREEYSRQSYFRFGEYDIYLSSNAVQTNEHEYTGIQLDNPLNNELIKEIKKIDGVNNIMEFKKLYLKYEYNNIHEEDSFAGFSRQDIEIIKKNLIEGNFDYDTMIEKNQLIISSNDVAKEIFGWEFKIGDKVKISYFNGKEDIETEFEIVGSIDYNSDIYEILCNSGWFIVPDELLDKMMPNINLNVNIIISTDFKEKGDKIETKLNEIVDKNPLLQLATLKQELIEDKKTYDILVSTIIGLAVFIIGFSLINLINTLITNIMTRQQEFAMLQSIGMSNRQLTKMIQSEGILLALGNIVITLLIGTPCGFILIKLMVKIGADYMHYKFPIWYFLVYILIIIIAPVIISASCIKYFQKKSLVERLRKID